MPKKKPDKKTPGFEVIFKDVFVCKKSDFKPYMEIFIQEPENITQNNLGIIAGILEISDESEESSYIVNYLISVIKKEYYLRPKRGPVESFEAALHKANLALAKLAEHENIGWIGKINAIVLVIEKNNLHLSQTGSARALLLRGKFLTDISENSPEESSPNPLKTFTDIISGRLEENDKLVITTRHMFDIFSSEEIKRSALKFSSPEFVQFLKTALGNELDCAAVLFIEIRKKEIREDLSQPVKKPFEINAFSQAAFFKRPPEVPAGRNKSDKLMNSREKQNIMSEIEEDLAKIEGNFVDKKTGHIYIKEDSFLRKERSSWDNLRENFSDYFSGFLSRSSKIFSNIQKNIPSIKQAGFSFRPFFRWLRFSLLPSFASAVRFILQKSKFAAVQAKSYLAKRKNRNVAASNAYAMPKNYFRLLPRISRIKNVFLKLNYSQKLYALLAIMLLLILPYFIAKIQGKNQGNVREVEKSSLILPSSLEQDKNVVEVVNLSQIDLGKEILKVLNLNGKIFAIGKREIIETENKNFSSFPGDFADLKTAAGMNDLNLIFLLDENNNVLSWSPIAGKFQTNEIIIPEGADISECAETYLTYLYLIDQKNNQIYRYPRAGEGFGEKINWLRDNVDLSQIQEMAINENIFLVNSGDIVKLSRGRKQNFPIEETATPIGTDKIYAERNNPNIYLLDKVNSRIAKFGPDGVILNQYYNADISQASDFTVNEENKTIYFSQGSVLKSFRME